MNNITVNDVLDQTPPGAAVPLVVNFNGKDVPFIFIKDYKDLLDYISQEVDIRIKTAYIENKKVTILLILIKIGEVEESIYDMWFDYGNKVQRDFLQKLLHEEEIVLDVRDETNERLCCLSINNELVLPIEEYVHRVNKIKLAKGETDGNVIFLQNVEKYNYWNEDDVADLLENVFMDYEDLEELWDNF